MTRPFAVALLTGLAVAAAAPPARAQDTLDLAPTRIVGNRELPKVLYIVPWKKPLPGELPGRPPTSVVDTAIAPLDREVFRRQLHYDALEQAQAAAAAPAAPAAQAAR